MNQNELPIDPHLGGPSSVAKKISSPWYIWRKPCTYLWPRLTPSPCRPKWASTWPTLPSNSIGCAPKWFLSPSNIQRCKPCTYLVSRLTLSPNTPKWASTWPHHVGVQSGVSKLISEAMVHLAQIMHLSCVEINTIYKRTETSFHLTHVT
jgi:hypothetical protein